MKGRRGKFRNAVYHDTTTYRIRGTQTLGRDPSASVAVFGLLDPLPTIYTRYHARGHYDGSCSRIFSQPFVAFAALTVKIEYSEHRVLSSHRAVENNIILPHCSTYIMSRKYAFSFLAKRGEKTFFYIQSTGSIGNR